MPFKSLFIIFLCLLLLSCSSTKALKVNDLPSGGVDNGRIKQFAPGSDVSIKVYDDAEPIEGEVVFANDTGVYCRTGTFTRFISWDEIESATITKKVDLLKLFLIAGMAGAFLYGLALLSYLAYPTA